MCGRFTMAIDSEDLRTQLALGQMPLDWEKRYNIAPPRMCPRCLSLRTGMLFG